jgi:hypothetical protein
MIPASPGPRNAAPTEPLPTLCLPCFEAKSRKTQNSKPKTQNLLGQDHAKPRTQNILSSSVVPAASAEGPRKLTLPPESSELSLHPTQFLIPFVSIAAFCSNSLLFCRTSDRSKPKTQNPNLYTRRSSMRIVFHAKAYWNGGTNDGARRDGLPGFLPKRTTWRKRHVGRRRNRSQHCLFPRRWCVDKSA